MSIEKNDHVLKARMKTRLRRWLLAALLFVVAGGASADVLVQYDPGPNDQVNGVIDDTPLSPDFVKTASLSASLLVQSEPLGYFNSTVWPVEASDGFDEADYVSFTVTPHPTAELDFESLVWTGVSYANSTVELTLRVTIDGLTEEISNASTTGTGFRAWTASFDLSGLPPVTDTAVEFRLYPLKTGGEPDWADLAGSLSGGTGLTLNGTATEPTVSTIESPAVATATGTDNGPADGTFDEIVSGSYFSWNGYTESRHAAEFDLTDLPDTLVSATLRMTSQGYPEGPRFMQLNGYDGDGAITLSDFEQDNLLGSIEIDPDYEVIRLDITDFLLGQVRDSKNGVGFNFRESPACSDALDCVNLRLTDISVELSFVDVLFSDSYEDDGKIRVAPTIDGPGPQFTDEDTATGPIPFTIGDDNLVSFLQVSVSSSDQVKVPDGNITLGGAGANRTIDILPAENQNGGPVTISITATDTENQSTTHQFQLTINPVNDAPSVQNPAGFTSIGNVGLDVTAGPKDLLSGATDSDGDTLIVLAGTFSTNQGGSVLIVSDGSFTYYPPAGFQGGDSFTFTVDDQSGEANSSGTGTASITVTDLIWFVDASAPGGGNGTLHLPFTDLTAFASAPDQAGENIYIAPGSYSAGHSLLNNQVVIGSGYQNPLDATLGITLPDFSLPLPVPNGTHPVISGAGNGLFLASGNVLRGLAIGNTTGFGIRGEAPGTLVISHSKIIGIGGGISLDSGVLSVQFEELSASATGQEGINLDNVSGSVAIQSGSIAVVNAAGVRIAGAGSLVLDVVLDSLGSSNSPNQGLRLTNTLGTFVVTGDGQAARNGSGGTIINSVSDGIKLENTEGVSLNRMNILSSGGNGITGDTVSNFSLAYSKIIDSGDGVGEHGVYFNPNLLGSGSFTGSEISGSYEHGLRIVNDSGTLNPLTLEGMTISSNGLDGLSLQTETSAMIEVTVDNGMFSGNTSSGVTIQSEGASTADLTIHGSTFTGGNTGVRLVSFEAANIFFDVSQGSQFTGQGPTTNGVAFNLQVADNSTAGHGLSGQIRDNIVSNTTGALFLDQRGLGKLVLDFRNNTASSGIRDSVVLARLGSSGNQLGVDADLTLVGNTLGPPTGFYATVDLRIGVQADACLNVRGNTVSRSDFQYAFDILSSPSGKLENFGSECSNSLCVIQAANSFLPDPFNVVDAMILVPPGSCALP